MFDPVAGGIVDNAGESSSQGVELELRATTPEVKERKVVVDVELIADGKVTARGHVICVQAPASLFE